MPWQTPRLMVRVIGKYAHSFHMSSNRMFLHSGIVVCLLQSATAVSGLQQLFIPDLEEFVIADLCRQGFPASVAPYGAVVAQSWDHKSAIRVSASAVRYA